MTEDRYTATRIAEEITLALGVSGEAESALQHRVRYLAKKGHLQDGKKVDARGTLEFLKIEVFRAALFCELLAASMDVRSVRDALEQAQDFHPGAGQYPDSARTEGGWTYQGGGLGAALQGVFAGEKWTLVLSVMRPGFNDEGGLRAFYTWEGNERENVDQLMGRKPEALKIIVDLNVLFSGLITSIGAP